MDDDDVTMDDTEGARREPTVRVSVRRFFKLSPVRGLLKKIILNQKKTRIQREK